MIEIKSHTTNAMTDIIVDVTTIEGMISDTVVEMTISAVIDVTMRDAMMKSDTTVENMIVRSITNVA